GIFSCFYTRFRRMWRNMPMTLYEKFKNLHIDFSSLGLEQGGSRSDYFCTPKGAKVIGWEGVDGIHYCFV
ncbi:hypothetical protein DK853_53380, partial [Klebsiella oxytoca]